MEADPAPGVGALAVRTQAVGLHGVVGPFDPSQEEWCEYAERLSHYFVANDIAGEEKRRAVLLTVVGPTTYRLLNTLASPKRLDELLFAELVDLAMKHFNPKPSPIIKRFEFNSRRQKEGESIAAYVAELRKIAEHCEYGAVLNDMLRDRLVCGTCNKGTQRRLLLQVDLTFDKAIEVALAAEAADKDSRRLAAATADKNFPNDQQPPPASQTPVYRVGQQRKQQHNGSKQQGRTTPPSGSAEYHRCGGRHSASGCPCREFVCHFCKKKGHLAKVCRRKNKYRTELTNDVNAEETVTESHQSEEHTLFQVRAGPSRPYKAVVKANGNLLPMEIDTGASVSVVGEKTLKTIQKGETTLELQQTSVRLQTYTGETIPVLGSVIVPVEHNGQTRTLPLIVTEGSGPSLLGRDWLSALRLDWKVIFSV